VLGRVQFAAPKRSSGERAGILAPEHRRAMMAISSGTLVVAGLFTLLPDRIMLAVLFRS